MYNKLSKVFTYDLICPKCGNSFKKSIKEYKFRNSNGKFYCSRTCANSRNPSKETREKMSKSQLEFLKKTGHSEKETRYCKICNSELCRQNKSGYCKHCMWKSDERRRYLSSRTKGIGLGGYRENAAKGLRGEYKGIHCDSTWELAYLVYQIEHGVDICRNTDWFKYIYENEVHTYYPDFREGDSYIEIKGREYPKWKYKLDQFPKDKKLKVLYKQDLREYMKYVKSKYGTNLTVLYDKPQEIDYGKYHWYTNIITKERKFCKGKLKYPYVLGRVN